MGDALRRTGVTADQLTAAGLVLAACTAVAVGSGRLGLGFALLVAAALPDLLDGAVAKASGTSSPRGAFFDSVADRVTDSLVLGGIAWHLAADRGGQAAMLPFAVLAVSALVPYLRAKAESLGYVARGGLMERAERVIALCLGLAFPVLLVPVLWLMLALTSITAVQRFVSVWRQASVPGRERQPASRWRSWREGATVRNERRWVPGSWEPAPRRRARREGRRSDRSWRGPRRGVRP